MSRPLLACVLALAACTPTAPEPQVGTVSFGGTDYPIRALASDPSVWRVFAEGRPVTCLHPTEQDCYWSLRSYLQGQVTLDELGS